MKTPALLLALSAATVTAARGQQLPVTTATTRPAVLRTLLMLDGKDWNDMFVDQGRNRIYYQTVDDSLWLYDVATKRSTGVARFPSWDFNVSRTGDRLAFVHPSEDGNHSWVWTLPLDAKTGAANGPARRLSVSESDGPEYSPDGKWLALAVHDSSGQRLVVIPADGGPERVVAQMSTGITAIRWTPDGRTIYFSSPPRTQPSRPPSTVYRVPASGGTPTRVMEDFWSWPGLSPDGNLLMFRVRAPGATYAVASTDGRELGRVVLPAGYSVGNWTSSTSVAAGRTEHLNGLSVLAIDGGNPVELLDASYRVHHSYWSPDGRRIAVSTTDANDRARIVVMNADGSNRRSLAVNGGDNLWWSPDGRHIAYHGGEGGPIQLLDVASGSVRQIRSSGTQIAALHWRSDSRSIFYSEASTATGAEHTAIREAALDGTDRLVRTIASGRPATVVVVLSDSLAIARCDTGVYLVSIPTGRTTRLTSARTTGLGPPRALQPGRFAFRPPVNSDAHTIDIVDENGKHETSLTYPFLVGPQAMSYPIFHPDRRHLIISGQSDTERAIYVAPIGAGDPRKLVSLPKDSPAPWLDLSPDGKHLLYTVSAKPIATIAIVDLAASIPSLKSSKPKP